MSWLPCLVLWKNISQFKDRLLTSMLCAKSVILLFTALDFLTVRTSLKFESTQSNLFRAAKVIVIFQTARNGTNWASWLDTSSKFYTWIMLSKRMGRPPRGEDRKIVYLKFNYTLQRAFGNKQSRSENKSKSFRHRGPCQPIRSCRVVGRFLSVGQS